MENTYQRFEDPGHSWLEVPINHLKMLDVDQKISGYSYQHDGKAYLEEDCDMWVFMEAYKTKRGNYPEIKSIYQENTPIRDYSSY